MIKVGNISIYGVEQSVHGMRNPMNSWSLSDSKYDEWGYYALGEKDLSLMKRLYKAGTEHRKYLRMMVVYMDITAPLYWWKEFDTYKVGTVANSCSTMHKIHSNYFIIDDFSHEHLFEGSLEWLEDTINMLNWYRDCYNKSTDAKEQKKLWWQMIQMLPSSYNQKRTVMLNYETIMSMINQRQGHKLDEWRDFVALLKKLPYVTEIRGEE